MKYARLSFLTPRFFLFAFCGGCGTVVNVCFSLLFAQKMNATAAYVGGYAVSLFVAYMLNAFLVFRQNLSISDFAKFVVSYIPNFIILFSFVAILLNVFHLPAIFVYAGAAILGLPVTYVLVKLLVFKNTA